MRTAEVRFAPEPALEETGRLTRLEVGVAVLHAFAFATVSSLGVLGVFGRRAVRELAFGLYGTPPGLSIFAGALLGWTLVLLYFAVRRPPRKHLSRGARLRLAGSGFLCGVLLIPLIALG